MNQDYSPISVCSIQRAFILVFLKKVELVENYSYIKLRSVTNSFEVPAVIRLMRYINLPYKTVSLSRNNIFKRDGMQCQYCGTKRNLTVDHVIPKAKGGGTKWDNLITACKICNAKKGDNEPHEVGMKMLSKPHKPSYIIFLRDFSGYICDEWRPYLVGFDKAKIAM